MSGNGTLVYAPDVAVYIHTGNRKIGDNGVLDLSRDIESFDIARNVNAESTFSCTFNNKYGKWDGIIPRMSRVVVFLKRLNWVQVFSGYVTEVPFATLVPGSASISASDTLKRLEHTYWDATSLQAQELLPPSQHLSLDDIHDEDGGAARAACRLMVEVGNWKPRTIHVGKIPNAFLRFALKMARLAENSSVDQRVLDALAIMLDANGVDTSTVSPDGFQHTATDGGGGNGKGSLSVSPNAVPGVQGVYDRVLKVAQHVGLSFVVTSWKRGDDTDSWHYRGHAIDLGIGSSGRTVAEMDKMCRALLEDEDGPPTELIWKHSRWENGQEFYYSATDHFDHIHVAYENPANTSPAVNFAQGGGDDADAFEFDLSGFGVYATAESLALTGDHAFINDVSLLSSVTELIKASMRDYQTAPNGDFVAWFPDRFGQWGKTPAMKIRNIELIDAKLTLSDTRLATHVAAFGDLMGAPVDGIELDYFFNEGIVSVEDEKILYQMLGLDPDKKYTGLDGPWIMKKFGMRPDAQNFLTTVRDKKWAFFYALRKFMTNWAQQYSSTIELTFMPELYPGMRAELVDHNLAVYVESVQHRGDRESGFTTSCTVTCPMRRNKRGEWVMLEIERTPIPVPEQDPGEADPQVSYRPTVGGGQVQR